jgi:hypothetical protein
MIDKRARKILFSKYWGSAGWLMPEADVPEEDFEYAKSMGYMFEPFTISHDEAVAWLLKERGAANPRAISDAFVASLGNRRLDQRSALASYGFAVNFPHHLLTEVPARQFPMGGMECTYCGLTEYHPPKPTDLNVLSFERHKWGGVRHDTPVYAAFDLEQFRTLPQVIPSDEDIETLRSILDIAVEMGSEDRPNALEKALGGVFKSNKAERQNVISTLGYCGVLQPRNKSGYFGEFSFVFDREETNDHANDWPYPIRWWRGQDGINTQALKTYFPQL